MNYFKDEIELIDALEKRAIEYNQGDENERKVLCHMLGIKYIPLRKKK